MTSTRFSGAFAILVAASFCFPVYSATFQIISVDGLNEGFNDPTSVAPVGNNTATTLGAQRMLAFEFAASLWGALLESDVTIIVEAEFNPEECSPLGGVLGFAGPVDMFADFPGAPLANTWYVSALADRLAGFDQSPGDPDIFVTMNSALDDGDDCLEDTVWYYGIDGNAPAGTLDVVETILHELAHGLGFLSLANQQGQFPPGNTPDIYSRFLFDLTFNEPWSNLSSFQRQTSSINDPNLVWTGAAVTASLPDVLDDVVAFFVEEPSPIAGTYEAQEAEFGPAIPANGISGQLALATDGVGEATDGCEALLGFPPGSIALIDRGLCDFTEKVANAQAAGAAAVIIANNEANGLPPMGGTDPSITIPSLGVSMDTGQLLRDNFSGNLVVTLGRDPNTFAGTREGFLRLHAPLPFEPGSSVSHFTSDAVPDLLMEPSAGLLAPFEVDLTLPAFQDMGWTQSPFFTSSPSLTAQEGVVYTYTARIDDPDVGDTISLVEEELPPFLGITSRQATSLTMSGTPGDNEAGTYTVRLRATDSFDNEVVQEFNIQVQGDNDLPVFETAPATNAELGQAYLYDIQVTDADPSDSVAISATRLPASGWLIFSTQGDGQARLAGTPTLEDQGQNDVTLRATDSQGGTVLQSFTITVADGPPVITLNGDETITLECQDSFEDPGATAEDAVDGMVNVVAECNVNTALPGTYTCTYTAEDSLGSEASVTRTIEVVDTTAPEVTLNGDAAITIGIGGAFDDPSATANDDCNGTIVVEIVGDEVDTNTAGEYTVVYSATDPAGNTAEVTRTVTVLEDLPPTIALNGEDTVTVECGGVFSDPGAMGSDPEDGVLSAALECTVDTNAPGTYTCTYTVTDSGGNTAMTTRSVMVQDTEAPVITLNGPATVQVEQGTSYTEQGALATDGCEGDLQVMVGGDLVNVNVLGTYTVEYSAAADSAGNEAVAVTRTVTVVEAGGGNTGCASGTTGGTQRTGDLLLAAAAILLLGRRNRKGGPGAKLLLRDAN